MPVFLAPDNRHETAPRSSIPAVEQAIREAWNAGYRQGYTRESLSVPHPEGTVEFYWWREGWRLGNEDMGTEVSG